MKKILIILLFGYSCLSIKAQQGSRWINNFSYPHLSFETSYYIGSPSLHNRFINKYFEGAYLNDATKNLALSTLDKKNILGGNNYYQLFYAYPASNVHFANLFFFSLTNTSILDMSFEPQLFELVFSGNTKFAGTDILLNENSFYFTNFSQLKGGFSKIISSASRTHTIALSAALNVGSSHNYVKINNTRLHTAADATAIDIETKLNMQWVTENIKSNIKYFNGIGTGLDIFYAYECLNGNNFNFWLKDLGFIHWFEESTLHLESDTAINFEGLVFDDFTEIASAIGRLNSDTLAESFNKTVAQQKSFRTYLPLSIQAYFSHTFNETFKAGAGFQNYPNLFKKPMFFADLHYQLHPTLKITQSFSYGGYSNFSAGLNMMLSFKDFLVYIGSDHLTSYINNDLFRGQGFFLRISKKFNHHETRTIKHQ